MVSFLFAEVGDLEVFVYSLTKYHTLCGPPGWFFFAVSRFVSTHELVCHSIYTSQVKFPLRYIARS